MVIVPHTDGIASNKLVTPLIGALHSSTMNFVSVVLYTARWAGIAQLVRQLATGWVVWGSNPGGDEMFHTCPDRHWGLPSLLYDGYWVFSGGKAAGVWH